MPELSQQDISYQPATKGYSFSTNPVAPPPPQNEQSKKTNKEILLLILEISGMVAVFLVLLLLLNFFNIISLSKIYPNQLGWLPHLNQTQTKATNQTTPAATNQPSASKPPALQDIGPFASCPVEKVQCQNGQSIKIPSITQLFQGLEYKTLNPNTNILAVIPGDISTQNVNKDEQNFLQINVTNNNMNTIAQYLIPSADFSLTASASSVTTGGVLGTYKNKSSTESALLLSLQVISSKFYTPISVAKDGSGLNQQ